MAHNAFMQVDGIDGELITLREWSVMDTASAVSGHNVTRGQVAPQHIPNANLRSRRVEEHVPNVSLCLALQRDEHSCELAAPTLS